MTPYTTFENSLPLFLKSPTWEPRIIIHFDIAGQPAYYPAPWLEKTPFENTRLKLATV